jgi:hypothetical protein
MSGPQRLAREWIAGDHAQQMRARTKRDVRLERQTPSQGRANLRLAGALTDDEGAGRANVDDAKVLELCDQLGWPEYPMAADIHAAEEDDRCHGPIPGLTPPNSVRTELGLACDYLSAPIARPAAANAWSASFCQN